MQRYDAEITGEISQMHRISGTINSQHGIESEVRLPTVVDRGDVYSGDIEFKPSWEEQTIETADKYLEKDISISSIQLYEVSNDAGGITISI